MPLNGSASSNMQGGYDATLSASHSIGTPNNNLTGGAFVSGSTTTPGATTGAFGSYNNNGHSLGVNHVLTPQAKITTGTANLNLMNDGTHSLNANAFKSHTELNNGFKFNSHGAGLGYNHAAGHAASITASQIPKIGGTTVDVMGRANLWTSQNKAMTFDAVAQHSRTFGGAFNGQKNTGGGFSLTHRF